MAASLIRLHFHDCFGEQTAPPNANSARGYEVIEAAKGAVESICPGVVSCADVLSVAARDASVAVGGPSWTVNLGRRDSTTARRQCPATGGNDRLAPLDLVTPNSFDNNYFRNLVQRRGLLQSDQVLFSGGSTDSIVTEYVNNPATFASDFAAAMVRMGNIQPLTGQSGIIRRTCGAVN
ncbi:peroxidase p7 [Phtheirospermum japonicum]|uniref:peroxidase n=1 Tax=Phtheirospermum japonicum TaxID=374723 RepID=A0A830D7V9_9LAMI|nr:peroxidase p7 [Phtheirospermum japonicum]